MVERMKRSTVAPEGRGLPRMCHPPNCLPRYTSIMAIYNPDTECLLDSIQHIVHDYSYLVSSGIMVTTGLHNGKSLEPPVNTHAETAFLTHCRKFYDFFVSEPKLDDVCAKCFVKPGIAFALPEWESWRTHMNKQLLHITFSRNENKREWTGEPNRRLLAEFMAAWRKMNANLDPNYESKFKEEIARRKCQAEYAHIDLT
jgi:hypothetical protein